MKKILTAIMCMVLIFCYIPAFAFADADQTADSADIYVAADGNDATGDGTKAAPYA